MENQIEKIALLSDDISPEEFQEFLQSSTYSQVATVEVTPVKKEGRGVDDLVKLVFSDGMAQNLMAAVIYDLLKNGFSKLMRQAGSKPKIIIQFKDGSKLELPRSMSDQEIQQKLLDSVQTWNVTSIRFLS